MDPVDVEVRDTRNIPIKSQLDPRFRINDPYSSQGSHGVIRTACFNNECQYIAKVIPIDDSMNEENCYTSKDIARNELLISLQMAEAGVGPSIYDTEVIIIMKKYDGTLADLLYLYQNDRSIPMKQILKLVDQMLQIIHENGMYHRDFNASNILYTKEGLFAITDYGSAIYSKSEKLQDVDRNFLAGIVRIFKAIKRGQTFTNPEEIMLSSIPYPVRFLWHGRECSDWE